MPLINEKSRFIALGPKRPYLPINKTLKLKNVTVPETIFTQFFK